MLPEPPSGHSEAASKIVPQWTWKTATEAALNRAGLPPEEVDSVIFGNVLQAGIGQNAANRSRCRVPYEKTAMTINEVCGSGLKAIILASQAIRLGDARTVVVGGTESMSQAPYLLPNQRWGSKLGNIKGYAETGIDPAIMGYAPYYAIKQVLDKTRLR